MMTSHFYPLKSCSCPRCRRGRRTVWGKADLHIAEKKFRQHAKVNLRRNPNEYETVPMPTDYTD